MTEREKDEELNEGRAQLSETVIVFTDQKLSDLPEIYNGEYLFGKFGQDVYSRPTVVKICSVNERNKREAMILSKVKLHSNVITMFEAGICNTGNESVIYIAVDRCHKETLRQFVESRKEISHERKLSIVNQLLSGVEYIHGEKIANLDLEPGKILFSLDQETVRIADFCSSVEISEKKMFVDHFFGTDGFRPPESFGNSFISLKTDIFSLGAVFYFVMSNGKNPFGGDLDDQNKNIMNGNIDLSCLLVPNQKKETKNVIKGMLRHRLNDRPTISEISEQPCWTGHWKTCDSDYESCESSESDFCYEEEESPYDPHESLSLAELQERYCSEELPIRPISPSTSDAGKGNRQNIERRLKKNVKPLALVTSDLHAHSSSDLVTPTECYDNYAEKIGKLSESSEERPSTNDWLRWGSQRVGDVPQRIVEVLAKARHTSEKLESDVDEAFANVNLHQMAEMDKTIFLHQIAHAYQSMGKSEKSVHVAKQAFELPDASKSPDNYLKALLLSLACCATEVCIDMLDLSQAVEHYQRAKDIFANLDESAPKYNELARRIKHLKGRLDRFQKDDDNQITRCIGPSGGVIDLEDCTIHFHNDALKSEILFHASLDFPVAVPKGKILVTPVLRLNPNIKLEKPISVKLTTWLASLSSGSVRIYYRKTENSQWKEIESRPTFNCGQEKIEFEIDRFCQYGCCIDHLDDGDLKIASRLFSFPTRKMMTNHFMPNCKTLLKRDEQEHTRRGLERACEKDFVVIVKEKDKLQISISDVIYPETRTGESDMSEEIEITPRFLQELHYTPMNFLLLSPLQCNLVDFTHTIRQYRRGEQIHEEYHPRERIAIGSVEHQAAPSVHNITAHNIAYQSGQIQSQETNANSSVSAFLRSYRCHVM